MSDQESIKVVDAFDLDDELRSLLKPGEMMRDAQGRRHRLPRYFYEIPDHEAAVSIRLSLESRPPSGSVWYGSPSPRHCTPR